MATAMCSVMRGTTRFNPLLTEISVLSVRLDTVRSAKMYSVL